MYISVKCLEGLLLSGSPDIDRITILRNLIRIVSTIKPADLENGKSIKYVHFVNYFTLI